jgi:hypothetical protein
MFDVYLVVIWEKINPHPFRDLESALLFCFSQCHNMMMTIVSETGERVIVRNGNPDRVIQPYHPVSRRYASLVMPLNRP